MSGKPASKKRSMSNRVSSKTALLKRAVVSSWLSTSNSFLPIMFHRFAKYALLSPLPRLQLHASSASGVDSTGYKQSRKDLDLQPVAWFESCDTAGAVPTPIQTKLTLLLLNTNNFTCSFTATLINSSWLKRCHISVCRCTAHTSTASSSRSAC